MRRIALTKKYSVEQPFQQQLQHLNYEVFVMNCCEETIEHELTFLIILMQLDMKHYLRTIA